MSLRQLYLRLCTMQNHIGNVQNLSKTTVGKCNLTLTGRSLISLTFTVPFVCFCIEYFYCYIFVYKILLHFTATAAALTTVRQCGATVWSGIRSVWTPLLRPSGRGVNTAPRPPGRRSSTMYTADM